MGKPLLSSASRTGTQRPRWGCRTSFFVTWRTTSSGWRSHLNNSILNLDPVTFIYLHSPKNLQIYDLRKVPVLFIRYIRKNFLIFLMVNLFLYLADIPVVGFENVRYMFIPSRSLLAP